MKRSFIFIADAHHDIKSKKTLPSNICMFYVWLVYIYVISYVRF